MYDSDSIYRPPATDPSHASSGNLLDLYIGPKNRGKYLRQFLHFERGNVISWHWPAFFLTGPWLLYRKMWIPAAAYILVLPLVEYGLQLAMMPLVEPVTFITVSSVTGLGIRYGLIPMLAGYLYFKVAKNATDKVAAAFPPDEQADEAVRIGGTLDPYLVAVVYIFGMGIFWFANGGAGRIAELMGFLR